jgi:DNA repair photolyase
MPRMRRTAGARVGVRLVRLLRLGALRMIPLQLPLVPEWAEDPGRPSPAMPAEADQSWSGLESLARGTSFTAIPPGAVLNPPSSTGMGFWSINPYVGCEFGCTYCYARETHRYTVERARAGGRLEPSLGEEFGGMPGWEAFERRILVKAGADAAVERSLHRTRGDRRPIVIGTATDPYQPAERRFGLTRRILETLARHRGLSVEIITKSSLVTRDIPLLRRIAEHNDIGVNISLATLDPLLIRKLEPRTPVPQARLRALKALRSAGVDAGLLIAPILPGLTDGRRALSRLVEAGRDAGARWAMGGALRLGPGARKRFIPYFEQVFPELAARYRAHYLTREGVSREYQAALDRRLAEVQLEHGMEPSSGRRRQRMLEGRAADPEQVRLL